MHPSHAMSSHDRAREVLAKHFQALMSDHVKTLLAACKQDLMSGPLYQDDAKALFGDDFDWPGYSKATNYLQGWWSEHGQECWVDLDCSDECAVGYAKPAEYDDQGRPAFLENTWHFDRREAKQAVFGILVSDGGF